MIRIELFQFALFSYFCTFGDGTTMETNSTRIPMTIRIDFCQLALSHSRTFDTNSINNCFFNLGSHRTCDGL